MYNELIFILHVITIAAISITALAIGPHALIATIALQGVLSNLFITKQITLFGLSVTCSDAFAVGSVLSLNLLQEFYGKTVTKKAIFISFFSVLSYLVLSQIHLLYQPNNFDVMHAHFFEILYLMPRVTITSIFVYFLTQNLDAFLYNKLKLVFNQSFLTTRSTISMAISQLFDTVLFSFLALYGVVGSVINIIIVSYAIKTVVITLLAPCIKIAINIVKLPNNK